MKQGFVLSHLGRRPRTGEERRIPRSSRVKGVVKWLLASFLGDSEVGEEAGLRPCLTEGSPGGKKKKKRKPRGPQGACCQQETQCGVRGILGPALSLGHHL